MSERQASDSRGEDGAHNSEGIARRRLPSGARPSVGEPDRSRPPQVCITSSSDRQRGILHGAWLDATQLRH